jgi:hypothetical protein
MEWIYPILGPYISGDVVSNQTRDTGGKNCDHAGFISMRDFLDSSSQLVLSSIDDIILI